MTGRVYLSPPDVGELEEQYVVAALRSGWIAPLGPDVDAFEREMADRTGVGHAVALSSGTAALHLALLGVGVGPGDVVLVPTMTFVASANAVVYTGAEPVFVDVEPTTGNLDPAVLDDALGALAREGRRVAAVLPVDLLGRCADYDAITKVCAEYDVPMISDAAESLGAAYRGRSAGSFGRAAALSFNGNKVITTSGGGMLLSDDGSLASRARYLATQARQPVVHYEHLDVGYNYRLSNLLAALGRAQLRRLDAMIARRRAVRREYRAIAADVPGLGILDGGDDSEDNCWLTSYLVDPALTGWTAADLAARLTAHDVETRPLWKPMHRQPVFDGARSFVTGAADGLFATGITLPSGSAHDDATMARVTGLITDFVAERR
ncbi:MAG TPA: aminotransferase class I/II-fold pyridoxal phosphate-dependent enzyme [Mycobacteriales bacterium]|nr:lipopolysaccharide biosynthesis protein RffA [Mycobacterium sp.]HEV7826964.1 aminotransferase class I/II-fold pyridoxal phosphate-dependent enzyme [Mycobacteriales bacterium]